MISKELVKAILEKADHYEWTLQGLGMLRMYLSEKVRLHVWTSTFLTPDVSQIHDHPWDFQSVIIAGRLRNQRYRQWSSNALEVSHQMATLLCGANGGLVSGPETARLLPEVREEYFAGQTYSQRATEIHSSHPADGTVTIIERTFGGDRDHAHVFWPRGSQWVSAEPRSATPEEVTQITQNALRKWFY